MGPGTGVMNTISFSAKAHLNSNEGGSDVEASVLGERNPLLVDLHQLLDALQQFFFIKQLQRKRHKDINCQIILFYVNVGLLCLEKQVNSSKAVKYVPGEDIVIKHEVKEVCL